MGVGVRVDEDARVDGARAGDVGRVRHVRALGRVCVGRADAEGAGFILGREAKGV